MAEQKSLFEIIKSQVINHDIPNIFENVQGQEHDLFEKYQEKVVDIFEPYLGDLSDFDVGWIKERWDKGESFLIFSNIEQNKINTPLEIKDQLLLKFNEDKMPEYDYIKYFFSAKQNAYTGIINNWAITRSGDGIKKLLGCNSETKSKDKIKQINQRLTNHLVKLKDHIKTGNFENELAANCNNKDLSVFLHMSYPQIYPIFYTGTKDGYTQIKGIKLILSSVLDNLKNFNYFNKLKLKNENLKRNYFYYAQAYRFILFGYKEYLEKHKDKIPLDALKKDNRYHWDSLTKFLGDLDFLKNPIDLLIRKKAMVLFGVPGTGKTHTAEEIGKRLTNQNIEEDSDSAENKAAPPSLSRYKVIQMHPNYSYQDFVIGIKPKSSGNNITYPVLPGPLYLACNQAAGDTQNKYFLIIDEINRADVAKVFGELMYCLEYRGKEHPVTLPQIIDDKKSITSFFKFDNDKEPEEIEDCFKKGKEFYIPDNIYFIGTMNTVDRSLTAFDLALRRRFGWYELNFSPIALRNIIEKKLSEHNKDNRMQLEIEPNHLTNYIKRCTYFNETTIKDDLKLPKEKTIGHTYFAEIIDIMLSDRKGGEEATNEGTESGNPEANPTANKGKFNKESKLKISYNHLNILWLYHLQPLLEEYLGFDFANSRIQKILESNQKKFTKSLNEL